jgi:NADPH:quinone reductase
LTIAKLANLVASTRANAPPVGCHCEWPRAIGIERLAFSGQSSAYAKEMMVEAEWLIPLSDESTFEQGVAFPLQGMTAHYLIQEFRKPTRGDFALVHAACGGLGGPLTQWARHFGAKVIGTVSGAQKVATAHSAAAEHVIVCT